MTSRKLGEGTKKLAIQAKTGKSRGPGSCAYWMQVPFGYAWKWGPFRKVYFPSWGDLEGTASNLKDLAFKESVLRGRQANLRERKFWASV